MTNDGRRDVATRKITLFHKLARGLVQLGLKPNTVSILSSVFAIIGGICFGKSFGAEAPTQIALLGVGVLCIQLRLICNLIDGLMAVECGLKTASGEIFNDVPDRISDVAFIVGAGIFAQSFAPWVIHLAWLGAIFAVLTAYVRVLGTSMNDSHDFSGPMAKQHRMFLLTLGAVGGIAEVWLAAPAYTMSLALVFVTVGSATTCGRRLNRLYRDLEKK